MVAVVDVDGAAWRTRSRAGAQRITLGQRDGALSLRNGGKVYVPQYGGTGCLCWGQGGSVLLSGTDKGTIFLGQKNAAESLMRMIVLGNMDPSPGIAFYGRSIKGSMWRCRRKKWTNQKV